MAVIDTRMTAASLTRAQLQVYNVCNQGGSVILIRPSTATTAKDEFGKILTEVRTTFKAFPIRFTPFDRVTQERIAWTEDVEIICYISKKAVADSGITMEQLKKKYKQMIHQNKTYNIRYVDYYGAFADDYLYVLIAGKS